MSDHEGISRRGFLQASGAALVGGAALATPLVGQGIAGEAAARPPVPGDGRRLRVALVGTGVRGIGMYGRPLMRQYAETAELVGVCDSNPGRLQVGREMIGTRAPGFVRLEEMLTRTRPDWLVVTSWDWEHHNHIVAGMRHGAHIIVEKPITIDERKAQAILDAQRETGKQVVVTHNYRFSPHRGKLKELLQQGVIGDVTSVDFHWNITHDHLQRYMQRWHGQSDRGGTLWVHKSSHHFDLINWWLDSEPTEVFAFGALERFGRNGPFRGANCRSCAHKAECPYHFDITRSQELMQLYVQNEQHDGYIRDNCVFRESIDIHDKHSAVVKYANGAYLNYSLTGEAAHEGFWLAFNGTKGRLEGREGGRGSRERYHDWHLILRGKEPETIRANFEEGGHWGGDPVLLNRLFRDPSAPDPLHQAAGAREGVMSVLAGVAARRSAASGAPVRIAGLTDLQPQAKRQRG
jgi:predicted dehydrogenase